MSGFASTNDLAEKMVSFDELGPGLYAYTAEGDPNTGIVVGDDARAGGGCAGDAEDGADVIERIRTVTDKPIKHVVLSPLPRRARAGRLGLSRRSRSSASDVTRDLIVERGAAGHGQRDRPLPAPVPRQGEHPRPDLAAPSPSTSA